MDRIGEYVVKRLVGEGGMGKVYEAEERLSKRRVALKVLRPELTRNDDGRRLFLNEMQILAHLEHPALVRSLASMETDGQLVMVLEFLAGRTLRKELTRRGTLPWTTAVEHVVAIAGALTVAHEHEPAIVHRDLKPENIMLLADGDDGDVTGLKVMDFGIAKVLEGMQGTNTQSIGTLAYMSPEQIDAGPLDGRSDLYALGLVFYEMIAGDAPFRSSSPRELLNLQCTASPPPLPEEVRRVLPRGVEEMLFAMLAKAPGDRPSSARDVEERLGMFCSAGGTRASRGSRPSVRSPRSDGAVASRSSEQVQAQGAPTPSKRPATSKPGGAEASEPRAMDTKPSGRREVVASSATPAATPVPRAEKAPMDTVALIERNARAPREVPTWAAVGVIAMLSLLAGLGTYAVRATRAPSPAEAASTTAASIPGAASASTSR